MEMFRDCLSSGFIISATFLAVYLLYRSCNNRKYPPSLPWLPVVGSLPFLGIKSFEELPQSLMKKAKTLGNVFAFYGGSKYIVVLNGREAIHEALVKRSVDFANRLVFYGIKKSKLRDKYPGIIMRQYNEEFKQIRHQILSIFKDFGFGKRIMEDRITTEVVQVIQLAKEMKGEAFDCHEIVLSSVMNVLYSIAFGVRQEPFGTKITEVITVSNDTMNSVVLDVEFLPLLRFLPRYQRRISHYVSCMQKLQDLMERCIDEALGMEGKESENFVLSFVNSGSECSELPTLVGDLIVAGTESTTTTILWSLILLANHPEVQERLHLEIDSVVPRDRLPSLDDKSKLPYVEAAILEVMRYKTLGPFALPHKTLCDTEVGGYYIPQDTMVVLNIYSAHNDPRTWTEPNVFRPERFLDDVGNVIGRDLVIAFSLGKRSCPGEHLARHQLFLFFAGILQQFEIRPPVGENTIIYEEKLALSMTPTPFKVRLIPRQQ